MDEKFAFIYDRMSKNTEALDILMGALNGKELRPQDLNPIMLELGAIMKGLYSTQLDFVEGYSDPHHKELLTSRLEEKIYNLDQALDGMKGKTR